MDVDGDLDAIWQACERALKWREYQELLRLGVPSSALIDYARHENAVGVAEIHTSDGRWMPARRGQDAIIAPVREMTGEISDLVAFRVGAPRAWWLLTGAGMMLGFDEYYNADWDQSPLTVHETPLEWLKANRTGSCLLDLARYWPLWLSRIPHLVTASEAFGLRLYEALQRPLQVPDVRFPQ